MDQKCFLYNAVNATILQNGFEIMNDFFPELTLGMATGGLIRNLRH